MARKQLKDLLNPCGDGELADIVRRARDLGSLARSLGEALPDEYAGAIVAANVRDDGELVVIASSSAWASRLRYETDALLDAARNAGVRASACRVRVSQG
jgi:hypothetical protein